MAYRYGDIDRRVRSFGEIREAVVQRLRVKSSAYFAIAMASSVALFLLRFEFVGPPVIVAGLVAVLIAALLGYRLGSWYFPVEGERPGFELVAVPLLILFSAVFAGAATVMVWCVLDDPSTRLGESLLWIIPASLLSVALFISVAWPAILGSFLWVGIALARLSRDDVPAGLIG